MSDDLFLKNAYREEAYELLDTIETDILQLEKDPDNPEVLNSIFRALHTIKGSGNMFGFENVAIFTHEVETLYDHIRKKNIGINREIIDLTFTACDHIRRLIKSEEQVDEELHALILNQIAAALGPGNLPAESGGTVESGPEKTGHDSFLYRIQFKPEKNFLVTGPDFVALLEEIAAAGEHLIIPRSGNIPDWKDFNPVHLYMEWIILISTSKTIKEIEELFIFIDEQSSLKIDLLDYTDDSALIHPRKMGEILIDLGSISREDVGAILKEKKLFGQVAIDKNLVSRAAVDTALKEQEYVSRLNSQKREAVQQSTIRVNYHKIDTLTNLVSELITLKAKYTQLSLEFENSELISLNEQLDGLLTKLHKTTMNIRMVPLTSIFATFTRLVRDLSGSLDKKIDLVIRGGETELDKNVIEKLKDPLMHIIRNAVDHGIEDAGLRQNSGKAETGTILLSAEHVGAQVHLKIKDDGAGLDPDKIRQTAVKKGVLKENSNVNNETLYSLIFSPGFSTSESVTNISGRGIGMDVVKKNIEKIKGTINISSEKGVGTEIILKIPLTLAIVDGLLVQTGKDIFVLNADSVIECHDFEETDVIPSTKTDVIRIRGEAIPVARLSRIFNLSQKPNRRGQLVIVNTNNRRMAIVVDNVVGKQQIVLKPVGNIFNAIKEISGATILGDGRIALILDSQQIMKRIGSVYGRNDSALIHEFAEKK